MPRLRFVRHALASATTIAALTVAPLADAANDVFLQVDGIQGESVDREFKDAISVQDFSFGVSNGMTTAGGGAGKASLDLLTITKRVDRSSNKLFIAAASGQNIPTATLSARKSGAQQGTFYRMKLGDVSVASVKIQEGAELTEKVSLTFGRIEIEYFVQDPAGRLTSTGKVGWDVRRNAKL